MSTYAAILVLSTIKNLKNKMQKSCCNSSPLLFVTSLVIILLKYRMSLFKWSVYSELNFECLKQGNICYGMNIFVPLRFVC